jgi:hypothetical protein
LVNIFKGRSDSAVASQVHGRIKKWENSKGNREAPKERFYIVSVDN